MERLLVSFLNTRLASPDPLETGLEAARWWASVQSDLPRLRPALSGKPRFDGALLTAMREIRAAIAATAAGEPAEFAFTGRPQTDAVLFPIVHAACGLFAGPRARRLKPCVRPRCGVLFLDETKNGSRRWCSLACMERARAPLRQAARVRVQ
jgi:predicted RNA-binding Zn ribbon-like protein